MHINLYNCIFLNFRQNATSLYVFHSRISKREMYPENDTYVPLILKNMSKSPIVSVGK